MRPFPAVVFPLLCALLSAAALHGCAQTAPENASVAGDPPAERAQALASLTGSGPLADAIKSAARATGVPAEVLAAAVFSESRWRRVDAEPGEAWGVGALQLDPPALALAAQHAGQSEAALQADLNLYFRAAASLVRRSAGDTPPASTDLHAWLPHLSALRTTQPATTMLVEGATHWLATGFEVERPGESALLVPALYGRRLGAARPDQPGVRWVASPNYSDRSRGLGEVDTIVIHVTQGSYGGAVSWFQNPDSQVSAHYVIRSSDGQVTQMVEEQDIGWHARCWNGRSVGIEHEGFVDEPQWFTDDMYRASANLVRGIAARWNIPLDRTHIKGHNELSDCNDHSDPGPNWDWDRFMSMVRDGVDPGQGPATGRLLGFVREGDIRDATANIAGARVSVAMGPSVVTGADGLYRFEALPVGQQRVHVEAPGFVSADIEREVVSGSDAWGSVALTQAASAPPPPATEPPPETPPPTPERDAALQPDAGLVEPGDASTPEPPPPETAAPVPPDAGPMGVVIPAAPGQNEPGPIGASPQRHTASHTGGCSTQAAAPSGPWSLAAGCALWAARRRYRRATPRDRRASLPGAAL